MQSIYWNTLVVSMNQKRIKNMTIETKFDLEETVFFISDKKIESSGVKAISCFTDIYNKIFLIEYTLFYMNGTKLKEKDCFKSRQELIESL